MPRKHQSMINDYLNDYLTIVMVTFYFPELD